MSKYIRKVQYHETDKMGITHHSNYVKWMEEARVDFLDCVGLPYAEMEKIGLASPVVSIEVKYRAPTTFGDVITVDVNVVKYTGVRLELSYVMKNADGKTVVEASSVNCFLSGGQPVAVNRAFPQIDAAFKKYLDETSKG